jgi:hypothetical protein
LAELAFWGFVMKNDVQMVILSDSCWVTVVKQLYPEIKVQIWKDNLDDFTLTCVDFTFSDVDLSKDTLKTLWSYVSKLVVCHKALQRVPHGWNHRKLENSYSAAGGVTNRSWCINLYTAGHCEDFGIMRQAKRDLSCMINPKKISILSAPQEIELHLGTFNYQRLLPWSSCQAFIIAPKVFPTTDFCRRRLTGKELMHVLDIPNNISEGLYSKKIKEFIADISFLPIKCISTILDGIL